MDEKPNQIINRKKRRNCGANERRVKHSRRGTENKGDKIQISENCIRMKKMDQITKMNEQNEKRIY